MVTGHLQHDATGHLLRNAAGHLAQDCEGEGGGGCESCVDPEAADALTLTFAGIAAGGEGGCPPGETCAGDNGTLYVVTHAGECAWTGPGPCSSTLVLELIDNGDGTFKWVLTVNEGVNELAVFESNDFTATAGEIVCTSEDGGSAGLALVSDDNSFSCDYSGSTVVLNA